MAWNNDPKVRELKPYADRHGFKAVIALCIGEGGKFEVISYGKTAKLCKAAGKVCDRLYNEVSTGEIEIPEELTE